MCLKLELLVHFVLQNCNVWMFGDTVCVLFPVTWIYTTGYKIQLNQVNDHISSLLWNIILLNTCGLPMRNLCWSIYFYVLDCTLKARYVQSVHGKILLNIHISLDLPLRFHLCFAMLFSMLSALPCTPWINSAMKLTKYGRFLWAHIQPWIFYTFFFFPVCLMDLDIKSTGISQTVWYVWESTVQNEVFISVNLMFGVCQIYWKMGSYTVWVTKESYHPSSTPMVSLPWMCSLNW